MRMQSYCTYINLFVSQVVFVVLLACCNSNMEFIYIFKHGNLHVGTEVQLICDCTKVFRVTHLNVYWNLKGSASPVTCMEQLGVNCINNKHVFPVYMYNEVIKYTVR